MSSTSALIDIGGSSVKVTIADLSSGRTFEEQLPLNPVVRERHVYLETEALFEKIVEVMNLAVQSLPHSLRIEKIFISTIRQGFSLIKGGAEVTPLILNSDTTGSFSQADIEEYGSRRIYEETGHWFSPQLTLPKLIQLRRVDSTLFEGDTRLLFAHDWLVWRLSNQMVTEMTLVSGGQLAFLPEKRVHYGLLEHFNFSPDLIPAPRKFGEIVGAIQPQVLRLLSHQWQSSQILVGGGDSHFLHAGASGNKLRRVVVSAGSSTPISLLSSDLVISGPLQPWKSTSFSSESYLLEGNLGYPGMFYDWLRKQGEIEAQKITIPNITKAPTIFGSCNVWNESKWENRPAFSILNGGAGRSISEITFGLTLDYAFALTNQLTLLISEGVPIEDVVVTGGGAHPALVQITQALLDIPVSHIEPAAAISNLFKLLENPKEAVLEQGTSYPELAADVKGALLKRAALHSEMYLQVEGTRQVIQYVS